MKPFVLVFFGSFRNANPAAIVGGSAADTQFRHQRRAEDSPFNGTSYSTTCPSRLLGSSDSTVPYSAKRISSALSGRRITPDHSMLFSALTSAGKISLRRRPREGSST